MENALKIERRVDVVSRTNPRYQCFVSLHHPDISGDVLWVRGPKRYTRKGAADDIPEAEKALSWRWLREGGGRERKASA